MATASFRTLPFWLRSATLPWAGALLATLLVLACIAFVRYERHEMEEDAQDRAQLYARVLEDHASRTVSSADLALQSLAQALEQGGEAGPLLRAAVQGQPFLRSISLVDARGRVEASSNPANAGVEVDLSGWRIHRSGLGTALPGRDLATIVRRERAAPGVAVMPLTRPLTHGAQLVALFNLDFFANQHALVLGDAPFDAALLSYDGTLLSATERLQAEVGSSQAGLPVFAEHLPQREAGAYAGPGLDGVAAHLAWRVGRRHPLVVVVQSPVTQVEQRAASLARQVAGVGGASLVLLTALTLLAWRSLRGHERVSRDLREARGTLAAKDAFTDRLFQVSPVPMAVQDPQGRLRRVNQAWSSLMGRPADGMLGHTLEEALGVAVAVALTPVVAHTAHGAEQHETRLPDAHGLWRDVMVRRMPFAGPQGEHDGTILCVLDISEFREAERRTREAKDAAERANAAKSEFIANVSHELRTPLQSILGFSELGADRAPEGSRVRDMFQAVHAGGQRMLTLVETLLDLSRMDATIGRTELREVDLRPLLQEVLVELGPLAAPRRVRLRGPAPGEPLRAQADPFRLQQVLRNVLANALRFAPLDSEVVLEADAEPASGMHLIRVRDHGPGIPESELESIFEPFVQSSRTKDGSGGTGLGLAICRKIMSAHHGSIRARHAEGGGAVFEIRLPRL